MVTATLTSDAQPNCRLSAGHTAWALLRITELYLLLFVATLNFFYRESTKE
jgi:hypothetical protein